MTETPFTKREKLFTKRKREKIKRKNEYDVVSATVFDSGTP